MKQRKCHLYFLTVEAGDFERTERWLSSWCRVNAVRDDRSILDVARSLGNKKIIELLEKMRHTTELVCTALACDVEKVKLLLALGKSLSLSIMLKRIS